MMNRKFYALGRLKTGQMNQTEQAYAKELERRKQAGEIVYYAFESLKWRLADNTFYTPDFLVMLADGHKVKGFWTDDARVKIKVASALFPFDFIAIKARPKKQGGGWQEEQF